MASFSVFMGHMRGPKKDQDQTNKLKRKKIKKEGEQ
jgi:hypothetical protein